MTDPVHLTKPRHHSASSSTSLLRPLPQRSLPRPIHQYHLIPPLTQLITARVPTTPPNPAAATLTTTSCLLLLPNLEKHALLIIGCCRGRAVRHRLREHLGTGLQENGGVCGGEQHGIRFLLILLNAAVVREPLETLSQGATLAAHFQHLVTPERII